MRKTPIGELSPTKVSLINRCPKCGGQLKTLILVGLGTLLPQKTTCVDYCGFEKDLRKVQHG